MRNYGGSPEITLTGMEDRLFSLRREQTSRRIWIPDESSCRAMASRSPAIFSTEMVRIFMTPLTTLIIAIFEWRSALT